MRKFAANYIVSESSVFLKNGILIAEEDGSVAEIIDTNGRLNEIAQLIFHNGILLSAFKFVKTDQPIPSSGSDSVLHSFIISKAEGIDELTMSKWLEIGKLLQEQFPAMKVPEILNEISEVLLGGGGLAKHDIPGIFLLIGVDLSKLKFTPKSRLKKIL